MRQLIVLSALLIAVAAAVWAADTSVFVGNVTTTFGKPIEGAEVSAYLRDQKSPSSGYKRVGKSSKTDKTGHYSVSNLPASLVYTIVVRAHGYEPKKWNVIGSRFLPVVLRASTGSVSGHVVDRNGKAVSGIWVKAGLGPNSLWTCRTDSLGGFRLDDLVGDRVTVCAGGDRFVKDVAVGAKDVIIPVDPDQARNSSPIYLRSIFENVPKLVLHHGPPQADVPSERYARAGL